MLRTVPLLALLVGCRDGFTPLPGAVVVLEEAPRNVLIVSVDTLRRDRIGVVDGSSRSPTFDRLLSEGVFLADHRSSSNWTYGSVLCALSGADQEALGFAPMRGDESTPVPDDVVFLAEELSDHKSALVSANRLLSPDTNTAQGYDTSCESCDFTTPAEGVAARGLDELDALLATGDPWLLHLHFMDPHLPYEAPASYIAGVAELPAIPYDLTDGNGWDAAHDDWDGLDAEARAAVLDVAEVLYHGQIAYLDDQLAAFLDAAEARGALDDTLVVLWADHGEQFFDHGGVKHGSSLYAEENRVIAGFWANGLDAATWSGPTTHADLAPTVLHALHRDPPAAWTGQPVGTAPPHRARYASVLSKEAGATRQSVDVDGKRLIYAWDGQLELYDLDADPTEHANLYAPDHPDVRALWTLLQPRVPLLGANAGAPTPVTPDVR